MLYLGYEFYTYGALYPSLFPGGVRILGRWCSTTYTETKETLYSVPILLLVILYTHQRYPISGFLLFQSPLFIPPSYHRPPPPLSPPSPLPPPVQFPPFPTTAVLTVPPASSMLTCTVPESVASKYNAWTYYAFAECKSPSDRTPPPLSSPLLRCNHISRPTSAVLATPSVSAPLVPGKTPGPIPYRGNHPCVCTKQ